jgi:inorganic pyrophosphatase
MAAFCSPPLFLTSNEEEKMILDRVTSGRDVPNDINVIIEIPAHSDPVKYEVDKETGAMFVDRFMATAMFYPCNYGYVPHTLSEDGDPVDVLVVTPHALISGAVVRVRPVGVLKMSDESGIDAKVLAVPVTKLTDRYAHINDIEDVPPSLLNQIAHFFEHYKDLEKGKWVKIEGWGNIADAKAEILASVKRFDDAPEKPKF